MVDEPFTQTRRVFIAWLSVKWLIDGLLVARLKVTAVPVNVGRSEALLMVVVADWYRRLARMVAKVPSCVKLENDVLVVL